MKARLIFLKGQEATLIMEDGGVATFHNNGKHLVTELYQNRIQKVTDDYLDKLSEGNKTIIDHKYTRYLSEEIIKKATDWLCFGGETEVTSVIQRGKLTEAYYIKEFLETN
jgi:hypothetical protein